MPTHRPPDRLCRGVALRVPDRAARSRHSTPCRMGSLLFLASGGQEMELQARMTDEWMGDAEEAARGFLLS
jgi:hypothetical protein